MYTENENNQCLIIIHPNSSKVSYYKGTDLGEVPFLFTFLEEKVSHEVFSPRAIAFPCDFLM